LAEYLGQRAGAGEAGFEKRQLAPEVMPFDAVPPQPVDSRIAWTAAHEACRYFQLESWPDQILPEWIELISSCPTMTAVPFCLGNYPQLLRQYLPLVREGPLSALRSSGGAATEAITSSLADWSRRVIASESVGPMMLAHGAVRLAGIQELSDELGKAITRGMPGGARPAWANEEAGTLWHRGEAEKAWAYWQAQAASEPVLFNRGMAALFMDRPAEARASLKKALATLPESSSWYHLGRLYLGVAQARAT
jgi:hypothetical protein